MIRAFFILIPLMIAGEGSLAAQENVPDQPRAAERYRDFGDFIAAYRERPEGDAVNARAITGYQVGASLAGTDKKAILRLLGAYNQSMAVDAAIERSADLMTAIHEAGGPQSAAGRILQLLDPIAGGAGLDLSLLGDSAVQVTLPASNGELEGGMVFYSQPAISESAWAARTAEPVAGLGAISASYAAPLILAMESLQPLQIHRPAPVSLILDVDGSAVEHVMSLFQAGASVIVLDGCEPVVTGTEGYADLTVMFADDENNRRRRGIYIENIGLAAPGSERPSATAELRGQNLEQAEAALSAFAGAYIANNGGGFSIMTDRRQDELLLTVSETEGGDLATALLHLFDYMEKAANNLRFQENSQRAVGRYWLDRMSGGHAGRITGYPVSIDKQNDEIHFTERFPYPPDGDAENLLQSVESMIGALAAGGEMERYEIELFPAIAYRFSGADDRIWSEAVSAVSGRMATPAVLRPGAARNNLPNLIRAGYCTAEERRALGSDAEYRSRTGMAALLAIATKVIGRLQ